MEKKTAVIYCRVSTHRQDTERQEILLKGKASAFGYDVVEEFSETMSGAKTRRPVLSECLEYCINNHIDCLFISELSRLGRNTFDVLENVNKCIERKINIYFDKEQLWIFDEKGRKSPFLAVMIATLGACAEIERENIYYRLSTGRAKHIADGGRVGRNRKETKTAEELESIRQTKEGVYSEVLKYLKKGYSVKDIARMHILITRNKGKENEISKPVSIATINRLKKEYDINYKSYRHE